MNEPTGQSPLGAAAETVDDQGRLTEDVACRRCGYNLRSLETDAVCPECGTTVAISIHGYYLQFAPLAWVRRLALGAKLLIASIATAIVGWLAAMGMGIAMAISQSSSAIAAGPSSISQNSTVIAAGPSPTFQWIMSATMIGLSLVITALLIAGIILLTARDPSEVSKPERFGSRRLARCCLWPIPVAIVGYGAMSGLRASGAFTSLNPLIVTLLIVIGIAWVASYLIMPAAMLRHFMGLMKRIPRPGMVTFAKIEFWAYLVVAVLGFGAYAVIIGMAFSPAGFAAATTTTTAAPTAAARLSQLGYVVGPSSAPAVASGAAGGSVTTYGFQPGGQVIVTGPGLTTMPASMPVPPSSRGIAMMIIAGITGAVSGCGGFAVGIAGLVFLIMAWRALAAVARQAQDHTAPAAGAAVPPV